MKIKNANDIKVGDTLTAGNIVSTVVKISSFDIYNADGEHCAICQIQDLIDRNLIVVTR